MIKAGDVVKADFPGITGIKRRPAVVISTDTYHQHRPDIIIGLLTTQIASTTTPTDYLLNDWAAAGLLRPSAFRSFLVTIPAADIVSIGRLSDSDWQEVQARVRIALAIP
jgi:mRNA interferase MazF